jgi:predicted nucleotidyltransferase
MAVLEQLFTSSARVRVLTVLLLNPANRFYQRQIQSLTRLPARAVQREMARLESLGLVLRDVDGNRVYYTVNRGFALYPELKGLVLKTTGLGDFLREHLSSQDAIQLAFIYGSYAANLEAAESDVDLFVVGTIGAIELSTLLRGAQETLHREINYSLYTVPELRERARAGDGFLQNVLNGPKIYLKGDDDTLRSLVA